MYDPAIARFTGVDPIADEFPWVTPYNYAENEPVGSIDLWGLQRVPSWLINKGYSGFDRMTSNSAIGEYVYRSGNEVKLTNKGEQIMDQGSRLAKDVTVIAGAALTTYLSAGTGTGPYAAAFGITTGVFGIGAGSAKLAEDMRGNYENADVIPGSPLGGVGLAIDNLIEGNSFSAQAIGDIATGFLLLGTTDWQAFDALNSADKTLTIMGVVDGIAQGVGVEVDSKAVAQEVLHEIYKPCEEECSNDK